MFHNAKIVNPNVETGEFLCKVKTGNQIIHRVLYWKNYNGLKNTGRPNLPQYSGIEKGWSDIKGRPVKGKIIAWKEIDEEYKTEESIIDFNNGPSCTIPFYSANNIKAKEYSLTVEIGLPRNIEQKEFVSGDPKIICYDLYFSINEKSQFVKEPKKIKIPVFIIDFIDKQKTTTSIDKKSAEFIYLVQQCDNLILKDFLESSDIENLVKTYYYTNDRE